MQIAITQAKFNKNGQANTPHTQQRALAMRDHIREFVIGEEENSLQENEVGSCDDDGEGGLHDDEGLSAPELDTNVRVDKTELLKQVSDKLSSATEHNITFSAWDYGGQQVFYALHSLFLTR